MQSISIWVGPQKKPTEGMSRTEFFAKQVLEYLPLKLVGELQIVGRERPELASIAIYRGQVKFMAVHYLGALDESGRKVLIAVENLTGDRQINNAVEQFAADNRFVQISI